MQPLPHLCTHLSPMYTSQTKKRPKNFETPKKMRAWGRGAAIGIWAGAEPGAWGSAIGIWTGACLGPSLGPGLGAGTWSRACDQALGRNQLEVLGPEVVDGPLYSIALMESRGHTRKMIRPTIRSAGTQPT